MNFDTFYYELVNLGKLFGRNFNEKHAKLIFEEVNGDELPNNAIEEVKKYLYEEFTGALKPIDVIKALRALNLYREETKDNFFCDKCGNSGWISYTKDGIDYACICTCNCKKAIKLRENPLFNDVKRFNEFTNEELRTMKFYFPPDPNEEEKPFSFENEEEIPF